MHKITNVKTSKTEQQERDFRVSLKARKRFYLQSTDWSQLKDVEVSNRQEIESWRRELRDFEIGDYPTDATEFQLEKIIRRQPKILFSSADTREDTSKQSMEEVERLWDKIAELEKLIPESEIVTEPVDDRIFLSKLDAQKKLKECFNEYRASQLIKKGSVVEYNLKKVMLEEAIDRKLSNGDSNTPLLDQESKNHSLEELDRIIDDCKEYFTNINELYTRLNKEERSVYNMDSTEINRWFESNGYRYRCKE